MVTVNNDYAYPNADSYKAFGRGGKLEHGWIFSIDVGAGLGGNPVDTINPTASGLPGGNQMGPTVPTRQPKKIKASSLAKRFQFNPSEIPFQLQMMPMEPGSAPAPGGNAGPGTQVGAAATQLKLSFDRQIEVARAINGHPTTPAYFASIGVAKDVMDLYRVILGREGIGIGTNNEASFFEEIFDLFESSAMEDESITSMNSELFDLVAASASGLNGAHLAVVYNTNLAYYGLLRGMEYKFQMFNRKMVPTFCTVDMEIEVLNLGSRSMISAAASPLTAASVPATGGNTATTFAGVNTSGSTAPNVPSSTSGGVGGGGGFQRF